MSVYEPPGAEVPDHILEAQERAALAEAATPTTKPTLAAVPTRIVPADEDAEAALLGAAMLSTTARDVLAGLGANAFYTPRHQVIADAMIRLHGEGQPTDAVTVADALDSAGQLDVIGGPTTLIDITSSVPATTSAPRYAQIIRRHATLRRIGHLGEELTTAALSVGADPLGLTTQAQVLLDELYDDATANESRLRSVPELLDDYLDAATARTGQTLAGVTTGITVLDEATGGLQPGRLYTIAGRPGMGKSDTGLALARHAAIAGHQVHVASIEMGSSEVIDRWVAAGSRIAATHISNGTVGTESWTHIVNAVAELDTLNLTIDDDPATTIATIRSDARKTKAELVIVDYIQIVDTVREDSRQLEVSALARALKHLARDLNIPVVILAQLNRGPEGRLNKRPLLADLRESGAIEQESDVVIGLYREEQYDEKTTERGVLELILLKNRSGPMKTVKVAYLPDVKIIANLAGAN